MLTQSPFDVLAETYDSDFTQSHIGKLQRNHVWKFLNRVLNSYDRPLRILEINCGTGEDALRLTAMGHDVIATDASEAMIEKAQQKLIDSDITSDQIEFIQCRFDELGHMFADESFDLVLSNFGGINCINKTAIINLSSDLFHLINAGGYLFLTAMSRCCLWEIFYYTAKGKLETAFRRRQQGIQFNVNGRSIPVYYYSPQELKKIFQSNFRHLDTHPVGLFIPPSYLEKHFSKHPRWLKSLGRWEGWLDRYSMLSPLADHYCMILKRP